MNQTIYKAIAESRLLRFWYKGSCRVAEPHTYGERQRGGQGLCAWQLSGGSGEDFRLFILDEMSRIECLEERFPGARAGYQRGDGQFSMIYAEL